MQLEEAATSTAVLVDIAHALALGKPDPMHEDLVFWSDATQRAISSQIVDLTLSITQLVALRQRLAILASTLNTLAIEMDFKFLFDPERRLLSIGYRPDDGTLDLNCYDLLASEARLASFFAIAKGDIPSRHWYRLGRAVTPAGHGAALISWSGSMFEYLMPSLVMREPAESIIAQTNYLIVQRQIQYAAQLGLPWGMSESAYNERDIEFTYQYSNFGVPNLGLKRGLQDNAVIAPYATALAAMLSPAAAVANFATLIEQGALGRFGFFEALDYTARRLATGTRLAVVQAFMAHHQAMTIVAIGNALTHGRMRGRFHADPGVQSTELLLHERAPRDVSIARPWVAERARTVRALDPQRSAVRHFHDPLSTPLQTNLLSNGRYSVMLTGTGAGYSRWNELAVTRWREDSTCDDLGSFIYIRDSQSEAAWSAGFQPLGLHPEQYEVTFGEDRATIVRRGETLTSTMEVLVSPEEDAEGRCVTISNHGTVDRLVAVTSYSELVLAPLAADIAHPAFSKLFVETHFDKASGALFATRRRREVTDAEVWASHHVVVDGNSSGPLEYETDRLRFLGRGRGIRESIESLPPVPLSGTVGSVLDPVFSLRQSVLIAPGTSARLTFWTAIATTRRAITDLVDRHRAPNAFSRASMLAWTQAQVQLRHLGVSSADACLFQQAAGHLIYSQGVLRPAHAEPLAGMGGPRGLWAFGISGDRPILLLRIDDENDLGLVQQLLCAQEYWLSKRLDIDLVILNERASSYVQDLQSALEAAARKSQSRRLSGPESTRQSVFLLRADLLAPEQCNLLRAVARVVLYAPRGTLSEQLAKRENATHVVPGRRWRAAIEHPAIALVTVDNRTLDFFNGLGGFSSDGREYVTTLRDRQETPAPWINVIANPCFGFQVSVEGAGYTWSINSKENQLTPWSNDPVSNRSGEAIYLRDEESGEVWSPTASPIRLAAAIYRARHGQGYSRFEHASHGIDVDMRQFVPLDDTVKITQLLITNRSGRLREISVTAYAEWVLGNTRMPGAASITTSIDAESRVLFATNGWTSGFNTRTAFADLAGLQTHWTADREEFIGRSGRLSDPAALRSAAMLSGRVGRTLDPCAALQAPLRLQPGASVRVAYFLGDAASPDEARALVLKYRAADLDATFSRVTADWDAVLGANVVHTPDRGFDHLLNRWLLYQTLVCRVWSRSAFYQASGAYGFRDQLQDGLALAVTRPALVREHLLRAASRQFLPGDVQHWWLPHSGQGVRTRISDDKVWLAYCTIGYARTTGDAQVLDEKVSFLEGQMLLAHEHEAFFVPGTAGEAASLYEHCARGLDQSLASGIHGLPLIGTGDWNDGFNRVGAAGKGESIWLAWFLCATLRAFSSYAESRGDTERVDRWRAHCVSLTAALDAEGWDGEWYLRAFYDDGTPLGSHASEECRIDSIAQSWSVIAGGGDPDRAVQAMQSLERDLLGSDDGLARLFAPPFEFTSRDPGYIKAYPAGVRENGGQYTHAAAWTVIALAMQGKGDAAHALFSRLGPIAHSATRAGTETYKVEPYVVAADIYSVAPHVGRGGWTWYTGSAAWLYQAGLQTILGVIREGASLRIQPCLPSTWPLADVTVRYRSATYQIRINNPYGICRGVAHLELDGSSLPPYPGVVPLVDDGKIHTVSVEIAPSADAGA